MSEMKPTEILAVLFAMKAEDDVYWGYVEEGEDACRRAWMRIRAVA